MTTTELLEEIYKPIPETSTEARSRFARNYYERGGIDPVWLENHIDVLVKIAVPEPRKKRSKEKLYLPKNDPIEMSKRLSKSAAA